MSKLMENNLSKRNLAPRVSFFPSFEARAKESEGRGNIDPGNEVKSEGGQRIALSLRDTNFQTAGM